MHPAITPCHGIVQERAEAGEDARFLLVIPRELEPGTGAAQVSGNGEAQYLVREEKDRVPVWIPLGHPSRPVRGLLRRIAPRRSDETLGSSESKENIPDRGSPPDSPAARCHGAHRGPCLRPQSPGYRAPCPFSRSSTPNMIDLFFIAAPYRDRYAIPFGIPATTGERPLFSIVLGNTRLSTYPGVSGAGPSPENTLLTPILGSELSTRNHQEQADEAQYPHRLPDACGDPRAMMDLLGMETLFVNAGLTTRPVIPCLDVYGERGRDPRDGDAVPRARELYARGQQAGRLPLPLGDLLVLGECVPGGTTTALCVLRGLGIPARSRRPLSRTRWH